MTITYTTIIGPVLDPSGAVCANRRVSVRVETGTAQGALIPGLGGIVAPFLGRTDQYGMLTALDGTALQVPTLDQVVNVANSFYVGSMTGARYGWSFQPLAPSAGTTIAWPSNVDSAANSVSVSTPDAPVAVGTQGPAGIGVPSGGAGGKILVKNTGTSYDSGWKSPTTDLGLGLNADIVTAQSTATSAASTATTAATAASSAQSTATSAASTAATAATAASTAQTAATAAQSTATAALPKAGGTMTGALNVVAPAATGQPPQVDATLRVVSPSTYPEMQRHSSPLANARAKIAALQTRTFRVLILGDSIVEGLGASNIENRWPSVARDEIRAMPGPGGRLQYPVQGSYGLGLNNILGASEQGTTYNGQTTTTWTAFWTKTGAGTAVQTTGYGFALMSTLLTGVVTMTATWVGDYVDIPYTKLPTGTGFDVSIDGAAATSYNAYAATQTDVVLSLGPFTDLTSHTIAITPSTTATTHPATVPTANAMIGHPIFYNGNHSNGPTVLNGGCGATTMANWASYVTQIASAVNLTAADLVVVALGINDINTGRSTSQLTTDLSTLAAMIRTQLPNASLAVVHPTVGNVTASTLTRAQVQPYWDALNVWCAANNAASIQVGQAMPDLVSPDATGSSWDNLHPSDQGHRAIAQIVTDELAPPQQTAAFFAAPDVAKTTATTGAIPVLGGTGSVIWAQAPANQGLGAPSTGVVLTPTILGLIWQQLAARGVEFINGLTGGVALSAAPPAAATEINFGAGASAYRRPRDWTFCTQYRLYAYVTVAMPAGARFKVQRSANHTSPSFTDIGATTLAMSTTGYVESAWASLTGGGFYGGPGDVLLNGVVTGGNSSTVPAFLILGVEVR